MKKREKNVLRKKDIKELKILSDKNRLDLHKTIAELKVGKQKDLKKVKKLRRDLAQTLTVLREKELMEAEKVNEE